MPGTVCTACRRSGQMCDFSRAPQKRGPSKGSVGGLVGTAISADNGVNGRYIKDLAERVNYLEFRTGGPAEMSYSPIVQEQPGPYAPSPSEIASRKRPFESLEEPERYDDAYRTLQDFASRPQRPPPDAQVREQLSGGGPSQNLGGHAPLGSMSATVDNEKWINM